MSSRMAPSLSARDGNHPLLRRIKPAALNSALAGLFVAVAFWFGISHGFHRVIPDPIESHNRALAAAITDLAYGVNLGGAMQVKILATLQANGVTALEDKLQPLGVKFPDNIFNPDMMNAAIARAFDVEATPLETQKYGTDIVLAAPYDLGQYIFYKLSFRLFGPTISSFYYFYFFVFAASVGLMLAAYRHSPRITLLVAVLCATHLLLVVSIVPIGSIHGIYHLATVHNNRFISALGTVAAIHLALSLWRPPPPRPTQIIGVVGQTAILTLAIMTRMSVMWGLLLAVSIIAWNAVRLLVLMAKRDGADGPIVARLRGTLSWPVPIVLAGVLIFSIWRAAFIHPLYRGLDEFLPQHVTWHTIYIGLALHPGWTGKFQAQHLRNGAVPGTDEIPVIAVENYLGAYGIGPDYLKSPLTSGIRWRTYERLLAEAYSAFAKSNPLYMIELHAWYKPRHFIRIYDQVMKPTLASAGPLALAACAILLVIAAAATATAAEDTRDRAIVSLLAAAFLVSLTPLIVAAPSGYASGDQIWLLNAFIVFSALTLLAQPARRILTRLKTNISQSKERRS